MAGWHPSVLQPVAIKQLLLVASTTRPRRELMVRTDGNVGFGQLRSNCRLSPAACRVTALAEEAQAPRRSGRGLAVR